MKIEYTILWVDDEPMKAEIERVSRYLGDLGFTPRIDKRESNSRGQSIDFDKYNLIVLDYQLNNSETTDSILESIQKKNYCSEIVFYSARGKFDNYIKNNLDRFEGVFWCEDRGQKLYQKIINVINLTLKKFQDLNNLRGMVMAETSDLDNLKKDIFKKYFTLNHSDQEKIKGIIIDKIEKSILSNYKKIKKYNGVEVEKILEKAMTKKFDKDVFNLIEEMFFDLSKKGRCIPEILRVIKSNLNFDYCDYEKKILKKRDYLAHSPEIEKKNIKYFGPYKFSETECKTLRKEISAYRDILISIKKEIGAMSTNSKNK